jgi:Protein of unknown function (DUF2510)
MRQSEAPPPGWYEDPGGQGTRWWDGVQWTEHVQMPFPSSPPQKIVRPRRGLRDVLGLTVGIAVAFVVWLVVVGVVGAITNDAREPMTYAILFGLVLALGAGMAVGNLIARPRTPTSGQDN